MLLYQILASTIHRNILKNQTKTVNLSELQHGMANLNDLIGHILYEIFKIIWSI